jgi:hypothetical protein
MFKKNLRLQKSHTFHSGACAVPLRHIGQNRPTQERSLHSPDDHIHRYRRIRESPRQSRLLETDTNVLPHADSLGAVEGMITLEFNALRPMP